MSNSNNISLWKQKSEIDYIPLFIPLWLSLNAWMKDRWDEVTNDRKLLQKLKEEDNKLCIKFHGLIKGTEDDPITFRGYFVELCRALENANIPFHKLPENLKNSPDKSITFKNTIIDWKDGTPEFENVIKTKYQQDKIKLSDKIYVDNNINKVFGSYIENLYQVRCALFHGDLPPTPENERVTRALYLTLQMIMEDV